MSAVGLLGAVVGAVGGVSVMAVKQLGRKNPADKSAADREDKH